MTTSCLRPLTLALTTAWATFALLAAPAGAQPALPKPADFSWRAPLQVQPGNGWARVSLPAQALMHLQSSDARDVRVFNSAGEAVAFAFAAPAGDAPAAQRTGSYAAHALFSAAAGTRPAQGSVQVRMDGSSSSAWVQFGGAAAEPAGGATRLQAALFDTRSEKLPIQSLSVEATLPANTPVRITAATSTDLAQWTPLPLRGRLYRFDGAAAMGNQVLALDAPASLEGRYLRLGWEGENGVDVSAVSGIAPAPVAAQRVMAALPAPVSPDAAGANALEWPLPFATPIRALALSTPQSGSVVPVRVLGRNDTSKPWQFLGQAAVYRLPGSSGTSGDSTNPPLPINDAALGNTPARWLRVESAQGVALPSGLQASVEFAPVQLVFVASGTPPFELAVGRAGTQAASMGASVLAAALPGKIDALPEAQPGTAVVVDRAAPAASRRKLVLWGVLGAGVLALAGVAWALFRQLGSPPAA